MTPNWAPSEHYPKNVIGTKRSLMMMRLSSIGTSRLRQMFCHPIAYFIAGTKFLKLSPFANCVIPRKVPSDTLFMLAKLHLAKAPHLETRFRSPLHLPSNSTIEKPRTRLPNKKEEKEFQVRPNPSSSNQVYLTWLSGRLWPFLPRSEI